MKKFKKAVKKTKTPSGDAPGGEAPSTPTTFFDVVKEATANLSPSTVTEETQQDDVDKTFDMDNEVENDPVTEMRNQPYESTSSSPSTIDIDELSVDPIKNFRKTGRAITREDAESENVDDTIMNFRSAISSEMDRKSTMLIDDSAERSAYACCGVMSLP